MECIKKSSFEVVKMGEVEVWVCVSVINVYIFIWIFFIEEKKLNSVGYKL